jgi:hypothetical protein
MSARPALSGRWRLRPSNHQGRACAQSRWRGLCDCRRGLHSVSDDPWMIDGISVNTNGCYGRLGCACALVQKAKGSLLLGQWLMRLVRADDARADHLAFVERGLAT